MEGSAQGDHEGNGGGGGGDGGGSSTSSYMLPEALPDISSEELPEYGADELQQIHSRSPPPQ